MTSTTEAELGALYIIAREVVYIRIVLHEMGHKHTRNSVQIDNSTSKEVINNKMQPKRTKAMHMRFHWLQYRLNQAQLRFYWQPGPLNYADYWKRHHPTAHHTHTRSEFLIPKKVLEYFMALQKKPHKGFLAYQARRESARVCRSHGTQQWVPDPTRKCSWTY